MKSGSVIPTSDSWVIKALSQATESTLFKMPGDSGLGSLGTELLGWYVFSWRWGRDAGWRGDAEDRNRSRSAPRHPPHGSPPGWECQQRLRNQWSQGQLYLRCALGQNCERGKGTASGSRWARLVGGPRATAEEKSKQNIRLGVLVKGNKDAGPRRNPARGAFPSVIVALPVGQS